MTRSGTKSSETRTGDTQSIDTEGSEARSGEMESGETRGDGIRRPGFLALGLAALLLLGLGIGFLLSPASLLSPGRSMAAGEEAGGAGLRDAGGEGLLEASSSAALDARPTGPAAQEPETRSAAGEAPASRHTPTVEAARRVSPSVVSIVVTRHVRRVPRSFFDLFFDRGFEARPGLGSGFAIDREGHILTNHHVVRDADSIVVIDSRGRLLQAELVGSDEFIDIAVLKVAPGRIPPAPIGTSSDLMVGEPAIALGNPTGFYLANTEATVTSGVISGVGRDIRATGQREVLYADMVQTDAAINPGNSGGPLVNAEGRVVGVNSSIFTRSGGSEGLGFAIPIERGMRIADELRRFQRIRRPWVGIDVASVQTDSLALQAVVRRVAPGSPGARAGVREGDVLLTADGKPVRSPLAWEVALVDAGVGRQVELRLRRRGEVRTAALRVEELPSERAERVEVLRGLQLVSVTPQIAVERRLEVERGALIVEVTPEVARSTGMRPGDVILAINQREVTDANDAAGLFRYYASDRTMVRVWIYRQGATFITSFQVR